MSISCQTLYEDIQADFGSDTDSLRQKFIRAVNRTLGELEINADNSTNFTIATSIESVLNIDSKYEYIIGAGIQYNLIRMGQRPGDPRIANIVYRDSKEAWDEGKGDYMMDIDNIRQSVDSYSMTKLGWHGDS